MPNEDIERYLSILIFLSSIISILLLANSYDVLPIQNVSGSPLPSFEHQEAPPRSENFFDVFLNESTPNGPGYIDIKSVSYASNGTYLYATIWLRNFTSTPLDYENVNYGAYIDADSNIRTGFNGIEYKLEITWNNESRTWEKVIEEWSSGGGFKTLLKYSNASDFFVEGDSHVTLSADLKSIFSSDSYSILFYAEAINFENRFDWIIDSTYFISIPTPELILAVSPNPVALTEGGSSTADLRITSLTDNPLKVDILEPYVSEEDDNSLKLITMKSDPVVIPPLGEVSTHLHVSASRDIRPGDYAMLMVGDVTPVDTRIIPGDTPLSEDLPPNFSAALLTDLFRNNKALFSQFPVSVQVMELTPEQQLKNFGRELTSYVNEWIIPITAILTFITGIVGFLRWLYKRKRPARNTTSQ